MVSGSLQYKIGLAAAILTFAIALVVSVARTTSNLDTGYLAGHEFRQSQTALSILFIQREDNFSLAYPTPVFGPPWSIPMEFPLYQWAAAKFSTSAELSIPRSSRILTLLCFYAALPGMFILLRRFGANLQTTFLALALILLAPIYLFYSRAVLIESMALSLSIWFLVTFDIVRKRKSWVATVATAILGGLAALVKVTTFAVWGGLALGLGIYEIVRLSRGKASPDRLKFMIQASLAGIVPLVLGISWVRYADAIKAASPGGFFLTSDSLESFNIGSFADRLNPEIWQGILGHSVVGVLPILGWLLMVGFWLLPGTDARPRATVWLTFATFAVWASFPHLYQIHDYYLYAMGVLPLAALAFAMQRFTSSTRWFWLPVVTTLIIGGLQWRSFATTYLPGQQVVSNGGDSFFDFIRDASKPDDVIVVVGNDWSASIPYYSQRRAMMLKPGIHDDPQVLDQMLEALEPYSVAGLLILGETHGMNAAVERVIGKLGLESAPTFSSGNNLFHPHQSLRASMSLHLLTYHQYAGVDSVTDAEVVIQRDPIVADLEIHDVTTNQALSLFRFISPSPSRYRVEYGLALAAVENAFVLGAHADTDLWIDWQSATATFEVEFGLKPYINEDPDNHSDGVWFHVWGVTSEGAEELIWERWIDPWNDENDRGILNHSFAADTSAFASFRFATRAGPNKAYDSAYWGKILVR